MKIPDYKISVLRILIWDALRIAKQAKQKVSNENYIDSLIETLEDALEELDEMD